MSHRFSFIVTIIVYLQFNVGNCRWIKYNPAELLAVAQEHDVKLSHTRTGGHENLQLQNGGVTKIIRGEIEAP